RRDTAAAGATAEGTTRTGGAGGTGRGETETRATAGSGTVPAVTEPEAREEAAEPGTDRGERPEAAADTATPARAASPGGTADSSVGLAAALGGARRSAGTGRGSDDGDGAPGRPKAPVLAAAGIAGVILLAVPLLIVVGDGRDERSGNHATEAADSRALLDGQEAQQPPGVYAAESPKDGAPAGSSKDEDGGGEKDGKKTEDGKKAGDGKEEGTDDAAASPDDSGPRSGSVTDASPQAASRGKKDTAEEPARRTEGKADTTVTVATARIVSADTGKCLTAGSRAVGAELVIQPCGASVGAQTWSFHDTDRTLRIGEDLCMGLDGGSVEKETAIRLQRCDGSSGQKFKINGTEDLVSLKAGDKCVDVWWGKEANGTPVKLWPCTGTANQTWRRG
ncbi:RICIN domain-containing protein, partial [Streptomyces sp. NPDC126497]|uniref:RICIN domain-containing protein n=1 Tax=Streptomyces sp. NPDC126497 TaxID=3155313 RepID=UPI003332C107